MQLKCRTLAELFNESLSRMESPDNVCLEIVRAERRENITFRHLETRAREFASYLIRTGRIRLADKAAILGRNRTDWDVALWAIVLAGGVPVLIDPERPVEGVTNHLLQTDTRLLVMADDYQDEASRLELKEFAARQGMPLVEMTDRRLGADSQECPPADEPAGADAARLLDEVRPKIDGADTAVILCTSGTTGDPREVELTHENLIANIRGAIEKVRISHRDILGHILPPHHSFGLTVGKLLAFAVGATNIYTSKYRQISELIRERDITIFIATPALYTMMAKKIEDGLNEQKKRRPFLRLLDRCLPALMGRAVVRKLGWQKLRFCLSGAAAMPRWVLDVFWKRGLLLYEGYGTTENSPVYGFNEDVRRLGSVGKPISTLQVKIVDDRNQTLTPGLKGEILLGGPCIMKGYYRNPGATTAVIEADDRGVRWLHTGDLGYLDEQGNLFITGRKKFLIVLPGGKNVNPELVEAALSEARFVREILVVPDRREDSAGIVAETVRALVQPDWSVLEAHTKLFCDDLVKQPRVLKKLVWQSIHECQARSRRLSRFEKISAHHLEIQIEEFQKTSTGKIKRQAYIRL